LNGPDERWGEKQIPCGNDRKKSKSKRKAKAKAKAKSKGKKQRQKAKAKSKSKGKSGFFAALRMTKLCVWGCQVAWRRLAMRMARTMALTAT